MKDKFDELLERLQSLTIKQYEYYDDMDISKILGTTEYEEVESEIDIDKHRWYETSVSVIKVFGRLLGIRVVSQLYSERSDLDDINWTLTFFEMEEYTTISYYKKVS